MRRTRKEQMSSRTRSSARRLKCTNNLVPVYSNLLTRLVIVTNLNCGIFQSKLKYNFR